MAWDKSTLVTTHTLTQAIIDKIVSMGPRGYEWLTVAGGGSFPAPGPLAIDATLAETLLVRGPRAAHMAQVLTGATPASASIISATGSNSFQFGGLWQPGAKVEVVVTVTDPDGESNDYTMQVNIPAGAPPEGWDAATAASVVCGGVDGMTHVRCVQSGSVLTLEPAAPSNTISATMEIVRG